MDHQQTTTPEIAELLEGRQRILVTGGAGFIGGAVVRRLLRESTATVFNLDKMGYASDLSSIEGVLREAGEASEERHQLLQVDLTNAEALEAAIRQADPDLVMHLAAESHVDRSIEGPGDFIASNVTGTFNLLQAIRGHWDRLGGERKEQFRLHHISTDEVFGSLGETGRFSETTPYDPRSPYSASKAASDHLVSAWHHTYGLPVVLTNCSNNYGPWQFPEKLIPVVILKAVAGEPIPLYGDGANIRDWLYVEDHVDALLLSATKGRLGQSYCVGGHGERTNKQVVEAICLLLDELLPSKAAHSNLITPVTDRPGHDRRYAIDPSKISDELGWTSSHSFEEGLKNTLKWFLKSQSWCDKVRKRANYRGNRLGVVEHGLVHAQNS
ncbi:dTDP-glucose 4,6-dehydratase [Synechococcus sp. CS-602]|uniref:dTDP-glucose 4,6-dehydratase n=1 Tax=Synechococcaceae TaxID=1890426 RepID=UPI0008FF1A17|nr:MULTISPECIES: dTDP-glucose 4,6-dehydratase [Synechococcaceae]MCT4365443.1 dTDP-glucose 4,6-dehydratase [Candidatus Regnicoccus frigidus MAG-AL1]APD47524.1 dTDP-glucose 4,6-dehydratase [Synechococcus sp. SynAce01]MCT0202509.1 dTDP-glucose 4,6-dehydratase [Synechococcus sp. CS-603]MCT0204313.1 dTDP-glucose 4,6-dehydratase [Synechococcus sp. CS-602]MCT0247155.1 dTDP-glucose 4,6-dehydratase [Synechococcus sp. CS-601]